SLIFLPFVFRFFWGLVALILSDVAGRWSLTWALLDNNHALTAFLFDLTGVLVILGVVLAVLRRVFDRSEKTPGLPGPDWFTLVLMAFLIISGFFLEANRIAMTGGPSGAGFAFVGNTISRAMPAGFGSPTGYVYSWYIHAVVTGIFIAYLPFSRMFHIVMAPISLAINAVSEHEKTQP
ncbi:MAG: respiratory nitrate reductase subunit gamma, partial [Deltaproteobacteria bacterium]|nr:respiratory nitrate reductase subunit gamma [Deltaproteobacteria bacterium]